MDADKTREQRGARSQKQIKKLSAVRLWDPPDPHNPFKSPCTANKDGVLIKNSVLGNKTQSQLETQQSIKQHVLPNWWHKGTPYTTEW
eukprot:3106281-Ditylum_brightwellii.AAC.1